MKKLIIVIIVSLWSHFANCQDTSSIEGRNEIVNRRLNALYGTTNKIYTKISIGYDTTVLRRSNNPACKHVFEETEVTKNYVPVYHDVRCKKCGYKYRVHWYEYMKPVKN